MHHALLIDNNPEATLRITEVYHKHGFSVDIANNPIAARDALLRRIPDVAMINLNIGNGRGEEEGFNLLEHTRLSNAMEIYLVAPAPSYQSAARAMRLGATDYFESPVDLNQLETNLKNFIIKNGSTPAQSAVNANNSSLLIGESPVMQRLHRLIHKVAPTEATVFLAGESGSGKEVVAQTIHQLSNRSQRSFVAVNCGAIAQELIESELFGHVKGAFTGATKAHAGFFEQAEGGTLLLDEVTEMPAELQVRLLRVLEVNRIRRVGGEQDYPVNVRIIASTNRDPEEAVAEGILRGDLYYRLAQFPIQVPALRERGSDIVLLAENFLTRQNEISKCRKTLAPEVLELLCLHDWPGNVRELRNVVARAHILAGEQIGTDDIPSNIPSGGTLTGNYMRISVGHSLADVERRMIFATLEHFQGDKKAAAATLGVSLKTLYNRLKHYNLA